MDIGAIIKAPMEDKDWIKKCAIMGLFLMIPIAGMLNLMGWTKAVYTMRNEGSTQLPDAGFDYLGAGWGVFLSMLPLMGVFMFFYVGIIGAAVAEVPALAIPFSLGIMVVALLMMVLIPAIYYRHFVHGDKWAALSVKPMLALVKDNMGPYVLFWVVVSIIAGFIAQLGMLACGVGLIVTMPLGQAIIGNAIAAFAKEVNNA